MRTLRPLDSGEVATLVDWAAAEGWNPGIGDAAAFHAADPGGFLGAFVDGEMVAGISAVAYGEHCGFIGLYICRPDRRGQGHGKAVWDAAMIRLAGRTIGLDGVPEQQANYRSMGFADAYGTVRLTGMALLGDDPAIVPCDAAMLPALAAYERHCFPAPREDFLVRWIEAPRVARAYVEGGEIRGYGVVRPCVSGHKIGPLFADTPEIAGALLGRLGAIAGGPVSIDVPAANIGAISPFFREAEPGFATARMYRGPAPALRLDRVFGTTTLELG
ncbi:MAG: GNAT family N-acetyltransferase [Hyphomicrobiales bacterium]|nr:MAG: GNAT family N-acetyltransferase [Hyphomicrobiales bacterium]